MIPLDVTEREEFQRVVGEVRPSVIYFAACTANVDYCEEHGDLTAKTNVEAVQSAVEFANRHGGKLVFFSSEYLFDGTGGPYDESASPNPICVYGRQKLEAERSIMGAAQDWLIIRTAVVFSWETQGKNFLYRLITTLRDGECIRVPVDQISSPTYAPDLAGAVLQLVERGATGVFNVTGPRVVSRYEFALAVARTFELDPRLIVPVTTAELNQIAPRPLRSGLSVRKVEQALGRPMRDYGEALREMANTRPFPVRAQ